MIFNALPTPQSDSFCPLQNIRGHELFLWQDFRFNPGHPRKSEQGLRIDEGTWNRWLEGLPTLIGVPKTDGSRSDFIYDEDAAFIFTGPFELSAYKDGVVDAKETEQLRRRMQYVFFRQEAAPRSACRTFNHCPLCWSRWILRGELQWQDRQGSARGEFMQKVAAALGHDAVVPQVEPPPDAPGSSSSDGAQSAGTFMAHLGPIMEWRQRGLVSDSEFAHAKQAIGLA